MSVPLVTQLSKAPIAATTWEPTQSADISAAKPLDFQSPNFLGPSPLMVLSRAQWSESAPQTEHDATSTGLLTAEEGHSA